MPDVAARSNEQRLARRDGVQTDGALGATRARCVRVPAFRCLLVTIIIVGGVGSGVRFKQSFMRRSVKAIQALLPAAVTFDADFDAAEDDFFAAFEVDTQLYDIPVVDGIGPRLYAWGREAHVVEESAGTALHVFDVPLPVRAPELAVPSTHDFGLEAHGCHGGRVGGEGGAGGVSLAVAP